MPRLSALPAIVSFAQTVPRHPAASVDASLVCAASYLAVWEVVGFTAFAADQGIRAADIGNLTWSRGGAALAGAAVLVAGLYALTPLKRACLGRCRGHAGRGTMNPLVAGWRYGVSCVDRHAGLMLVLFVFGALRVTWMLVRAAFVFVGKVPPVGASLVWSSQSRCGWLASASGWRGTHRPGQDSRLRGRYK